MESDVQRKPPSARERRLAGWLVRTFFLRNRRAGPWPVPDWLPHERLAFTGNSGTRVAGRWFPAQDARGVVVLVHPDRRYGQHWFVHTGWVDALHDRRFHVLTFDLPNYGESGTGPTYYHEDVLAAAELARKRAPDVPLHVVGVSLGAFAVANASPHLSVVDSIILESPYPTFNAWYGRGVGRWAMGAFDAAFPRTSALIQAPRNLARAQAKQILVVASRADAVTPARLSRDLARHGPAGRTRYLELEDANHLELFPQSAAYREAVVETLTNGSAAPGPRDAALPVAATMNARPVANLGTTVHA